MNRDYPNDAVSPAREPTLTEQLAAQLNELNGSLDDGYQRLDGIIHRMFGPQAKPEPGASKLQPVASSTADELMEGVRAAISRAYSLQSMASELQRRL